MAPQHSTLSQPVRAAVVWTGVYSALSLKCAGACVSACAQTAGGCHHMLINSFWASWILLTHCTCGGHSCSASFRISLTKRSWQIGLLHWSPKGSESECVRRSGHRGVFKERLADRIDRFIWDNTWTLWLKSIVSSCLSVLKSLLKSQSIIILLNLLSALHTCSQLNI